jgi:putative ABC transport system permease protein
LNSPWLTALWLMVMIVVADVSIIRASDLRLRRLAAPVFVSLLAGTSIPMLVFVGLLLGRPNVMDAQYAIPVAGMILGNCLRADIIGIRGFFTAIRLERKPFELTLAQGAALGEAIRPYVKRAVRDALAPTIASMATIGLVALPGMMTGAMLGGVAPIVAIKYQIAIMLAILCGTSLTVVSALLLSRRSGFTSYGILDDSIFREPEPRRLGQLQRWLERFRGH